MPGWIRPTQNMTRKAVFDIIGHDLSGLKFLELFAGSGAVGIEALSCGADKISLVERDPKCANIIKENLGLLGLDEQEDQEIIEVINADVFSTIKIIAKQRIKFDVVFIDPPYDQGLAKKALKTLMAYDILSPKSIVVVEHSTDESLPEIDGRFSILRQRKYGKSILSVIEFA